MAVFSKWIKKAVDSLVDPDRESRVASLIQVLQHGLFTKRQGFVLADAIRGIEHRPQDLEYAKEQVYRDLLCRGWQDGALTVGEQKVAQWAAQSLQLSPSRARELDTEFAKDQFASALAQAMDDGILDQHEEARLQQIAAAVGTTLPQFARTFFFTEGEGFLRSIFSACVAENYIHPESWARLIATSQSLGISRDEMLRCIQPQARRLVEHVLADAKNDSQLSEHEDAVLRWMISNLGLASDFCRYVAAEVSSLHTLTQITNGKLPSLPGPQNVAIRAGEIVHFHGPSIWRRVRLLKSGPKSDDHDGIVTMTDNRLIFSSPTISQNVKYRSIISFRGADSWLEIQTGGKPATTYFFPESSSLPYAIFRSAVQMANQTLVAKTDCTTSRHIPRDVRQRIWQRYGGCCADCGADTYLEFDHIIPVAKGGNNSDSNVQLLCRGCNQKKSDHI